MQEPLNENGALYKSATLKLSAGVLGREVGLGAHPCQGLMVFEAEEPNGDVLLFMHGGGWTNGYKEMMGYIAPVMNALGVTFVSVGYRLAPQFVFPLGWEDTQSAIGWAHKNIRAYGGRPDRIFVGGHSAGGHYAALLAVRHDWQVRLELDRDVIRGCLPISGIYDFMPGNGMAVRPRFLGPVEDKQEYPASPLHQVDISSPPFFIAHGSADFPHLSAQAIRMESVLKSAGVDVERIVLEERNHFTACYAAGEADGPWARPAHDWMRRH